MHVCNSNRAYAIAIEELSEYSNMQATSLLNQRRVCPGIELHRIAAAIRIRNGMLSNPANRWLLGREAGRKLVESWWTHLIRLDPDLPDLQARLACYMAGTNGGDSRNARTEH